MQKKTQKLKNNKKSTQTQKGGLFGFLKKKKTYDVQKAQAQNKKKPIELGAFRKIKNSPGFSSKQLNEFERLREEALKAYNKQAKTRPPRVYNNANANYNRNTGSARKVKKPENFYESITNGSNNGYGTNNGKQPIPPPRSSFKRETNI
jgi:hypothetical protein